MPMRLLPFEATAVLGQGVLCECLLDPNGSDRQAGPCRNRAHHLKLREMVCQDRWNYADIAPDLSGFQACFFRLGLSSAGITEKKYDRVTYCSFPNL